MSGPTKRIPLYQQIRDHILFNIRNDVWGPNFRIPAETELAEQFGVSRITIRGALAKLIEDGVIYRVQGKGSFISPHAEGEPLLIPSQPTARQESRLIAYLMPRLDNLFTANLLSGIETVLSENGYRLLFCKTEDSREQETRVLQQMTGWGVRGAIVYPAAGESYNEEILKLTLGGFPLVVVDRYLRGVETNCVCADNENGARSAVSHLIEHGHRKIGFISPLPEMTTSLEDRFIGYQKALAQNGIMIEPRRHFLNVDMKRVNQVMKTGKADEACKQSLIRFLKSNPDLTAVFAVNAAIGLAVMEAARELQLRVPDDLSVVWFDDYEGSAHSVVPPTFVSQQEFQLGGAAASLLLSILDNPEQKRRKIVTPTKLIVRRSTGPCTLRST